VKLMGELSLLRNFVLILNAHAHLEKALEN